MAIFDGLADHEFDRIKNTGTHLTLPANWSPISEKTAADKAYIILDGEASDASLEPPLSSVAPPPAGECEYGSSGKAPYTSGGLLKPPTPARPLPATRTSDSGCYGRSSSSPAPRTGRTTPRWDKRISRPIRRWR